MITLVWFLYLLLTVALNTARVFLEWNAKMPTILPHGMVIILTKQRQLVALQVSAPNLTQMFYVSAVSYLEHLNNPDFNHLYSPVVMSRIICLTVRPIPRKFSEMIQ